MLAVDAVFEVHRKHQHAELVEGCTQGRDLSQDIDTVALLVNHLLDAAHLTGNPGQPLLGILTNAFLHTAIVTRLFNWKGKERESEDPAR